MVERKRKNALECFAQIAINLLMQRLLIAATADALYQRKNRRRKRHQMVCLPRTPWVSMRSSVKPSKKNMALQICFTKRKDG